MSGGGCFVVDVVVVDVVVVLSGELCVAVGANLCNTSAQCGEAAGGTSGRGIPRRNMARRVPPQCPGNT